MGKLRVLLIDDEVPFTRLLKANLEATGRYEARIENRGAYGLAAAQIWQPDIILLDIIMPDCDGSQLAAEIQGDPQLKRTPVIFLTAIVSKGETISTGGTIGGNAFLAKPVTVDEVIACLEKYRRGMAVDPVESERP